MNASNQGNGPTPSAASSSLRWFKYARGLVPIAAVIAACSTPGTSSTTHGSSSSSSPFQLIAPSARTPLFSGFHAAAGAQNDLGRLDGSTQLSGLTLRFRLSPEQKADADALKAAQQDPSSPSYHRWLTPEQYAARFGATPGARKTVTSWLESQGFEINEVTRAGTRVRFSGTASQVEAAFGAEMHRYLVNDEPRFALASPALVPQTIGDLVVALHGADNFPIRPPSHRLTPAPDYTGTEDAGAGLPPDYVYSLTPSDWATIYGTESLISASTPLDGTGVTIAIVGASYYNPSDIAKFRSTFKLPALTITDVLVPGTGNQFYDVDAMGEAELDLEWSGGVAPGAAIDFVYNGDTGNVFDAMFYVADNATAPIMSASFSLCEASAVTGFGLTDADATVEFAQFGDQINLEGITFVAASGDTGPAGCDPNSSEAAATMGLAVGFPASLPEVTAVGGTGLSSDGTYWNTTNSTTYGSAKAYVPESAWNDTYINAAKPAIGASGGGASILFTKPVWQTGVTGIPADSHRYVPDIAFSAGGNQISYNVYFGYTAADGADGGGEVVPGAFYGFAGTSAATPSFAGVLAILNQALLANGSITAAGLGNVNPQMYALASNATTYASAFHDVTTGNNCVPCTAHSTNCPTSAKAPCTAEGTNEYGFAAGTGYDEVTGLGSLDVASFVSAWEALIPTTLSLSVTPDPGTTGKSVSLKATVGSTNTTAPAMTGTVSFFDQFADALGSAAVTAGKTAGGDNEATVTVSTTELAPGVDTIYAQYTGDKNYLGSFVLAHNTVIDDAGDTVFTGGTPILVVDAGLDAAAFDAAPPTGGTSDGGSGTADAGGSEDGGPTFEDSGPSPVVSEDSGPGLGASDSGPTTGSGSDSGPSTSEDASTGSGSSPGSSSGCSCKTAGTTTTSSNAGAFASLMLGLVAIGRRRRSRASSR